MGITLNYTVLVVCAAGLLATSGEIIFSWASPMFEKLASNDTSENPLGKPITSDEESLIGSLVNIGAIIGPYPFTFMADRFGRKITLVCMGVPHLVTYLSFAFGRNIYFFYCGRLLGGMSTGAGYALIPMYIAEITDDSSRGHLSAMLMLFWSLGSLLSYVVGPFLSVLIFNLILACMPTLFIITFLLLGVETPYYWLKKNEEEKARQSLMFLRSSTKKEVEEELAHMKKNIKREEGGRVADIIKNPALRKALFISISLVMLQQFTGIVAIYSYLQHILNASGSNLSSDISSMIYGVVIFCSSFIAPLVANKFRRTSLLIFSGLGMTFWLTVIGVFFYVHESTNISTSSISWMPLVSVILYLIFFTSGISFIPWTIVAELFPTSCKKISASTVSSFGWVASFIVSQFFNKMVTLMTIAGVFWFYAVWTFFLVFFCILFVPETKDKSFREIQDILGS